jgi:solute carrier family 40 (iron-regulated transporter), member 1
MMRSGEPAAGSHLHPSNDTTTTKVYYEEEEDVERRCNDIELVVPLTGRTSYSKNYPHQSPAASEGYAGCDRIGAKYQNGTAIPAVVAAAAVSDTDAASEVVFRAAQRWLYVSHFFAQLSEIAFQFCVLFFLSSVTRYQSLILVSTYGVVCNAAIFATSGWMGRYYVDDTTATRSRLSVARTLIWGENLAVLLATIACFVLLSTTTSSSAASWKSDHNTNGIDDEAEQLIQTTTWLVRQFESVPNDLVSVLSLIAIHIFGAVAQIMDQAFLVAIERDWVIVLCQSATTHEILPQRLTETNVAMKQIDLSCKIAAPALASLLIPAIADARWVCLWIDGFTLVALGVEYFCTARIYDMIPGLARKEVCPGQDEDNENDEDAEKLAPSTVGAARNISSHSLDSIPTTPIIAYCPRGFQIYMQQASAFGGIGLAVLYANALTFGNGILTAYLLYRGMPLEVVGILRGIASAIGLSGTVIFSISTKFWSLEFTGLWSICYQFLCLAVSLASLAQFDPRNSVSLALLVTGISFSRVGLWVFDITLTQLQQQEIPEWARGQVGGTQQSLNAVFTLLSFAFGILVPHPRNFVWFVVAGTVAVGTAMLFYVFGMYKPRMQNTSQSM